MAFILTFIIAMASFTALYYTIGVRFTLFFGLSFAIALSVLSLRVSRDRFIDKLIGSDKVDHLLENMASNILADRKKREKEQKVVTEVLIKE